MKVTKSPLKSRVRFGFGRQTFAIAVGAVAGLLAVVPLPYFIIAPGHAIDLGTRITVEGRAASHARFFLTDVTLARATTLGLLMRVFPATDVVPSAQVMPPGQSSAAFDRSMTDAMTESQNVASFVAERAAGYRVPEDFIVHVEGFPVNSHAGATLQTNDRVLSVAGKHVRGTSDIAAAIARSHVTTVPVKIERDGKQIVANVRTMIGPGGARKLGIYVSSRLPALDLPVSVRFSLDDVSGSSAGLMFALQIYADIHPLPSARAIAGTGTMSPDGAVGPIEGTPQKFEAARRAGATVFFVPIKNVPDLAHTKTTGIAIVPVATFSQALAYLTKRGASSKN